MNMKEIIYKNLYDIEISKNQAEQSDMYYKTSIINRVEKITERYENNTLDRIFYKLDDGEDMNIVLSRYGNQKISIEKDHSIGVYTWGETYSYNNGILDERLLTVKNISGNLIAFQRIDINTGLPILGSTEKYYHDSSGERKYLFDYDDTGNCFMLVDEQEFGGDVLAANIGQPDVYFTWAGFEYYQHANPLVPV
jgi:hypothetical protein